MGKTPRECEGTGVDRQDDEEYFDDDGEEFHSFETLKKFVHPVHISNKSCVLRVDSFG